MPRHEKRVMTKAWPAKARRALTCIVTSLSSTITSFVRKSAPIVALYWLLNFLFTYWFMSDVLPTLKLEKNHKCKSTRKALKTGSDACSLEGTCPPPSEEENFPVHLPDDMLSPGTKTQGTDAGQI